MTVSRNRLLAAFGNNVDANYNSVTLDSAIIAGLTYPTADGSTGQFLKTDGSGNLSFATVAGGGGGEGGLDSNLVIGLIDSNYVQARETPQDFAYSSLTGAPTIPTVPTNVSDFTNDANYLDSTTVTGVIDASYIQTNQTTYTNVSEFTNDANYLDSTTVTGVIDASYIQSNQAAGGLDSDLVIDLVDSAYISARSSAGAANQIQPTATSSTHIEAFLLFVDSSNTNEQDVGIDSGLTYNASTNVLITSGGFETAGTVTAADVVSTSDRRLKENIETINNAIDKVKQLRGVTFDKDGRSQLGVIAQEVRKIIPEAVLEANDDIKTLSVAYGNIVGLLIEAIKDQQAQIDDLKLKIDK